MDDVALLEELHQKLDSVRDELSKVVVGQRTIIDHLLIGLLSGGQRQALTLLMATLTKPKLLLLDEHTAALDPKTAQKVLEMSHQIISEFNLTAMMVTHNMRDAIKYGNRLIMMHEGKIILDIKDERKQNLKVEDLLKLFSGASGEELIDTDVLLS